MFSVSQRVNLAIAVGAFAIGISTALLAKPIYKSILISYWQKDFARLTFQCDQSMRVHFLAKQQVAADPNNATASALQAAEIGLLDCQTYDLMQKKMKRWGLTDNEVGEMVLRASEENGQSLRKVIRIHEIDY